ncbi:MAG: SAM-dependent chlorinase/fluorinase [Cyanobacteria bacterium P01_D01_bin.105]
MITLLSDFGYQDAYVAVMKGVIAAIASAEITCDLTHSVAPQDILSARFNLKLAYPHFPTGTVHLAVVDPGVGSARRAIAVRCSNADMDCFLVGPDNGILSGVIEDFMADSETGKVSAVALTRSQYWRSGITAQQLSSTFHGRDIFAPVAAHLANGIALETLGDRIDAHSLVKPDLPPFTLQTNPTSSAQIDTRARKFTSKSDAQSIQSAGIILGIGCIQHIDRFGNLISNIPEHAVPHDEWEILLDTLLQPCLLSRIKTYSDGALGSIAALVGSHGWIEIVCNRASAAEALEAWGGAPVGTLVQLRGRTIPS